MNGPLLRVDHLSLVRIGSENSAPDAVGATKDLLVDDVSFDIAPGECLGLLGASGSGKTLTGLAIAGVLPDTVYRRHGTIDITLGTAHDTARGTTGSTVDSTTGTTTFDTGSGPLPTRDVVRRLWVGRHAEDARSAGTDHFHPTAMVFQDPRTALSPVRRIGAQLDDVLRATGMPRGERRAAALALLVEVGLDAASDCLARYAFELSGGMCQRVLIALALARRPRLLIADEPTTGLDTRTQARVLDLLRQVAATRAMGTLLITHDLAVARHYCARIAVLHAGRIVEILPAGRFLSDAVHPRSRALIAAMPQAAQDAAAFGTDAPPRHTSGRLGSGATLVHPPIRVATRGPASDRFPAPTPPAAPEPVPAPAPTPAPTPAPLSGAPLLSVRGVVKHYGPCRGKPVLDDIGFDIAPGEALGIVGGSGCGKSTLAHLLARVTTTDAGSIVFDGVEVAGVSPRRAASARWRGALQLMFQDVRASLDPLSRVRDALTAPWRAEGMARASARSPEALDDEIAALAAQVALPLALLDRRPHQLSGGEATRVGLARALASRPRLLILDEPTASLDMTTQAEIVRTIDTLRRQHGMALLFISHDLELVRLLCTRVLVMDAGRIVESGDCEHVFRAPAHPVTQALLDARLRL